MTEITNKHIFITMIIIGFITICLIIPLYNNNRSVSGTSYSYNGSLNANLLGATAYNADYSGPQTNSLINGSRYPYQAVISKSYYPVSTSTTTTTGSSYDSYYYYSTTGGQDYSNTYYDNGSQGYVPAGCESGTDYSLTTGEPCG